MGVALFVTFERKIPGVEGCEMCGKILARNLDALDCAARRLGLMPLSEFHGANPEDLADLLGDDEAGLDESIGLDPAFLEMIREQHGEDSADDLRSLGQDLRQLQGEIADLVEQGPPPEQWFPPAEGLRSVRRLATEVRERPGGYQRPDELLADLADVGRFLSEAEAQNIGFHLSYDI